MYLWDQYRIDNGLMKFECGAILSIQILSIENALDRRTKLVILINPPLTEGLMQGGFIGAEKKLAQVDLIGHAVLEE